MKEIPITRGKVVLVDDIDSDLAQLKWYARPSRSTFYAQRTRVRGTKTQKTETEVMHRVILSRKIGSDIIFPYTVDHKNGDGLDNRRENLRLATPHDQLGNRQKSAGKSSVYKGVCWDKSRNKWMACINKNGLNHTIGVYVSEIQAAMNYDIEAKEYFGEFARLNFA